MAASTIQLLGRDYPEESTNSRGFLTFVDSDYSFWAPQKSGKLLRNIAWGHMAALLQDKDSVVIHFFLINTGQRCNFLFLGKWQTLLL